MPPIVDAHKISETMTVKGEHRPKRMNTSSSAIKTLPLIPLVSSDPRFPGIGIRLGSLSEDIKKQKIV